MAKIQEEIIVVKVSKLLKDAEQSTPIMGPDAVANLEAVIQELAGANTLVELAIDKGKPPRLNCYPPLPTVLRLATTMGPAWISMGIDSRQPTTTVDLVACRPSPFTSRILKARSTSKPVWTRIPLQKPTGSWSTSSIPPAHRSPKTSLGTSPETSPGSVPGCWISLRVPSTM